MSPLVATLVVTALAVAIAFGVARIGQERAARPAQPWWRSRAVWFGVASVVVLLGVFVAPQLLGFTFIFLPLFWIGGLGRRHRNEPRASDQEL